ncbi:hypothetical protein [Streptomyces sp. NPDC007088]|uniref:hypothetical protein n=1 Tax=Streptomyces sp. NPDC007088 TaxID=3364773 RepID=UPI0036BFEA97
MPPATEWFLVVLQSLGGRVSRLARRVAHLESLNNEQRERANRLRLLEEAVSVAPAPPACRGADPLGPLFDALESINSELTDFAARLARLEDTAYPPRLQCPFPRRVFSSSVTASVRAVRSRVRRAVSGA